MANDNEEPLTTQLWKAADKLRKNTDAAEYKHIVLGLIFLRYISDAFEESHTWLVKEQGAGTDLENWMGIWPKMFFGFLLASAGSNCKPMPNHPILVSLIYRVQRLHQFILHWTFTRRLVEPR